MRSSALRFFEMREHAVVEAKGVRDILREQQRLRNNPPGDPLVSFREPMQSFLVTANNGTCITRAVIEYFSVRVVDCLTIRVGDEACCFLSICPNSFFCISPSILSQNHLFSLSPLNNNVNFIPILITKQLTIHNSILQWIIYSNRYFYPYCVFMLFFLHTIYMRISVHCGILLWRLSTSYTIHIQLIIDCMQNQIVYFCQLDYDVFLVSFSCLSDSILFLQILNYVRSINWLDSKRVLLNYWHLNIYTSRSFKKGDRI